MYRLLVIGATVGAVLLAGCENKPSVQTLPEVNDVNCSPDNIAKLDKSIQQEFASQCVRRGAFKPSSQKAW